LHAPAGAFIAGVIYRDWNSFRRIRCEPDAVLIYRRLLRTDKYTLSTTEEQKIQRILGPQKLREIKLKRTIDETCLCRQPLPGQHLLSTTNREGGPKTAVMAIIDNAGW
jgi:hypothetical protein